MEEAFATLADEEPGPELATLAEALARLRFFLAEFEAAKERVERALEIAEALVLPNVLVEAMNTKHVWLDSQGRHEEALALLQHAIELGRTHDLGEPLNRALHNFSYQLHARDRFRESLEIQLELIERARRQGDAVQEQRTLGHLGYSRWSLGEWRELEEIVELLVLPDTHVAEERMNFEVRLALSRGDLAVARAALDRTAQLGTSEEMQMRLGHAAVEASVLRAEGRPLEALAAARSGLEVHPLPTHPFYKEAWSQACEAAFDHGDLDQIDELLGLFDRLTPSDQSPLLAAYAARFRARLLELRGDRDSASALRVRALDEFRALETPHHVAITLLEQAEAGVGDPAPLLAEAREICERLGAKPWLERIDAAERAVAV